MSKIRKQGILNTFWTYLGILAGALYTIFIVPKAFADHPEHWGLIQFLAYYTQVFLPLAVFGVPLNVIRFYSKIKEKDLPQFYFFSLTIVVTVTALVSALFFWFGGALANNQNEALFLNYYQWLIPMLVGGALFETFAAFSRATLKSSVPVFLKETVSKLWTLILLTLFYFKIFPFDVFVILYSALYVFQLIAIVIYVARLSSFRLNINFSFFSSSTAKQMYGYMLFSILGSSAAIWTTKIDVLMIGYLIDLQQVAFYTIALYIATLIIIPYRSMASIATPMIAGFWTTNELDKINTIYKKISAVGLVGGSYIFLAIWFNIDWVMHVLGSKFGNTEWVFFILGISKLIDACFGINGGILLTSKYFRYDLLFQILLIILTITLNLFLIPVYQLEGAASSTLFALIIYNLFKVLFLYNKSRLFPFTMQTSRALLLILVAVGIDYFLPTTGFYWLNAVVNIIILTGLYLTFVLYGDISDDLKDQLQMVFKKLN